MWSLARVADIESAIEAKLLGKVMAADVGGVLFVDRGYDIGAARSKQAQEGPTKADSGLDDQGA